MSIETYITFDELPSELIVMVLGEVDITTLVQLCLSSKAMYEHIGFFEKRIGDERWLRKRCEVHKITRKEYKDYKRSSDDNSDDNSNTDNDDSDSDSDSNEYEAQDDPIINSIIYDRSKDMEIEVGD